MKDFTLLKWIIHHPSHTISGTCPACQFQHNRNLSNFNNSNSWALWKIMRALDFIRNSKTEKHNAKSSSVSFLRALPCPRHPSHLNAFTDWAGGTLPPTPPASRGRNITARFSPCSFIPPLWNAMIGKEQHLGPCVGLKQQTQATLASLLPTPLPPAVFSISAFLISKEHFASTHLTDIYCSNASNLGREN